MFVMFLFNIGPLEFNFAAIISFIVGILMGFLLMLLIYTLAVISSLKTKNFFAKTEQDDLTTAEVKDMVLRAQTSYKDKELRADTGRVSFCYQLCKDLAYGIAVRFYPQSKYPFLELSINEITMLTGYITDRVNELLNHKGIRMFRKLKISTIVNISTKTKDIEASKAFQTTVVLSKSLSKAKYVLNIFNPLNWGKKLVMDNLFNKIMDKICLVTLAIVGEETYKIYSKKVFHQEIEIDTGSNEFIEEMTQSIKDAAIEIDSNISLAADGSKRLKKSVLVQSAVPSRYETYNPKMTLKQKNDDSSIMKGVLEE